jgi:hypothetical protein
MEGANLIKIHGKDICKCHSVYLLYNYYMTIKKKFNLIGHKLYS